MNTIQKPKKLLSNYLLINFLKDFKCQRNYILTTEIVPFANVTSLAMFSTRVPLALQEKGHDIRTIIPKYGYVSERKYILREVIRLREIHLNLMEVIV